MSSPESALMLFVMANQLVEHDLDRVEAEYVVDLRRGHQRTLDKDQDYYPQIEREIRGQAARMAPYYEVFYSLENTIRGVVGYALQAAEGDAWWETGRVPGKIKTDAEARRQREVDTGVTPRSDEPLAFTTFGELAQIITQNWDVFGSIFSSARAVERVMANLNQLRGPIAHCSPLAEDEVLRLRISVRDWFRLME